MSQFDSPAPVRQSKASANVYTALALAAVICLGVSIGYLWIKNTQLTGNDNPLYIMGQ